MFNTVLVNRQTNSYTFKNTLYHRRKMTRYEVKVNMYWGFYQLNFIDEENIKTLQSSIEFSGYNYDDEVKLPTNPGGQHYIYICIPSSFGNITKIYDDTNGFNVTYDYIDLGIIGDFIVWRSLNSTAGASGFEYNISGGL